MEEPSEGSWDSGLLGPPTTNQPTRATVGSEVKGVEKTVGNLDSNNYDSIKGPRPECLIQCAECKVH